MSGFRRKDRRDENQGSSLDHSVVSQILKDFDRVIGNVYFPRIPEKPDMWDVTYAARLFKIVNSPDFVQYLEVCRYSQIQSEYRSPKEYASDRAKVYVFACADVLRKGIYNAERNAWGSTWLEAIMAFGRKPSDSELMDMCDRVLTSTCERYSQNWLEVAEALSPEGRQAYAPKILQVGRVALRQIDKVRQGSPATEDVYIRLTRLVDSVMPQR